MLIEPTNDEIIIRLPASMDADDLQAFLDFARYKELTRGYKVAQKTVDALAAVVSGSGTRRTASDCSTEGCR